MVVDADLDLSSGESMTLEFKRHRSKADLPESELIETVVCLANGRGGRLVLGVEDDGTVSGFGPLPAPHAQLAALILNRTRQKVRECMNRHGYVPRDMPPGTFVAIWQVILKGKTFEFDRSPG